MNRIDDIRAGCGRHWRHRPVLVGARRPYDLDRAEDGYKLDVEPSLFTIETGAAGVPGRQSPLLHEEVTFMDAERFDDLSRLLAGAASRRQTLRLLLAGAVGAVVSVMGGAESSAATCQARDTRCGAGFGRCCGNLVCCTGANGSRHCRQLSTDPMNCGQCGLRCASGSCVHGACGCDPFDNTCPTSADGQCGCSPYVSTSFQAACHDTNSGCNLAQPCDTNADCPRGSVCLVGCADPPDNPRRCSNPCIPV